MSTYDPLSETLIASMAAGLLDDYEVSSLNDNTALGRFLSREFGTVRREFLELYPWYVAGARAALVETTAPAFEWAAAYQLPTDFLGLRELIDPCFPKGTEPVRYEIEGDKLLCDVRGGVYIKYTFDQTNVAKWRALMGRAFACRLAMYASQRVTGKSSYFDKCQQAFANIMTEAKSSDGFTRGKPKDAWLPGEDGLNVISARGLYR